MPEEFKKISEIARDLKVNRATVIRWITDGITHPKDRSLFIYLEARWSGGRRVTSMKHLRKFEELLNGSAASARKEMQRRLERLDVAPS